MRIFRFFLISLVSLAIVGGLSFLVAREILLTWGTFKVREGVSFMVNAGSAPEVYQNQCVTDFKLNLKTATQLNSIQLAFTDDTHFQIQVVCAAYAFEPIVIKHYQLPMFVTKAPGSAGFVFSRTDPSSVTLRLWGRTETVTFKDNGIQTTQGTASMTSAITPQAMCSGYGFVCCQEDTSVGIGDQAFGATDCAKACFSSCAIRPVVLSFNTEPFYNPQNRELEIANGDQVTFSFTSNIQNAQIKQTVLNFGDGRSSTIASGSGLLVHNYTCATGACIYQAALKVTDIHDVSNAETLVNKVLVKVR